MTVPCDVEINYNSIYVYRIALLKKADNSKFSLIKEAFLKKQNIYSNNPK